MLVAQCDVVQGAACQCGLDAREPDQRGLVPVRVRRRRRRRGRRDAGDPLAGPGRRAPGRRGRWLAAWNAKAPRRSRPRAGPRAHRPVEHDDVVRAFGVEQRAGVHRRRIERVVVARKQVNGIPMARMASRDWLTTLRRELVVLEDVARHDDELGTRLGGECPESGDRTAAGRRISWLGVTGRGSAGSCRAASRRCAGTASDPLPEFEASRV